MIAINKRERDSDMSNDKKTINEMIEQGLVYKPVKELSGISGIKFDNDKIRTELLYCSCVRSLENVAKVLTFGAKKYADDNWRKLDDGIRRQRGALHRHLNEYYKGQLKDSESGLDHLAHALCCLIFLYEKELENE